MEAQVSREGNRFEHLVTHLYSASCLNLFYRSGTIAYANLLFILLVHELPPSYIRLMIETNSYVKLLTLIISLTALLSSVSLGSSHIKSATSLSNAGTSLTNSILRLLLLVTRGSSGRLLLILLSGLLLSGSLLGLRGDGSILNSHGTFVDLREVVIFDGFCSG
jgi:hypothetical protein